MLSRIDCNIFVDFQYETNAQTHWVGGRKEKITLMKVIVHTTGNGEFRSRQSIIISFFSSLCFACYFACWFAVCARQSILYVCVFFYLRASNISFVPGMAENIRRWSPQNCWSWSWSGNEIAFFRVYAWLLIKNIAALDCIIHPSPWHSLVFGGGKI